MKIDGTTIRRTYLEVPTMDDRKWAKIPGIAADVFMADIEDSVPPDLKDAAREKVVSLVRDPSFFEGREFICRPNCLETPWGRDDLEALAEAHAPFVLYPKARSVEDVLEVLSIFAKHGAAPELHLIIETPQAIMRLEQIVQVAGVHGVMVGPGDLSLETGIALFDAQEVFNEGFLYARSKTLINARAVGLEATEGLLVANLKDTESVGRAVHRSVLSGFTGNLTFYPPHVEIINAARTPSAEEVVWLRRLVEAFEAAQAEGKGAVTLDGRWITVHQFSLAKQSLKLVDALSASLAGSV